MGETLNDLPTYVGSLLGTTQRFGSYKAHAVGTSYVAMTDGFVIAGLAAPQDAGNFNFATLQGVVDGKPLASTTAGNFGCFDSKWNYLRAAGTSSFLMPVPEGATWQVDFLQHEGSEGAITAWVTWMPLGVGPATTEIGSVPRLERAQVVAKPWEDFDPAIDNLVDLLESLFKQELTPAEKELLANAMKRLI